MPAGDASMDGELHDLHAQARDDLYAQARDARMRAGILAGKLEATRRKAQENCQAIRDTWGRAEQIRASRLAARTDSDRLRYSAYARLQARLASLPVIEQAKGILMARYGWPEDKAFDVLRRVSQRENIKVRDFAAAVVAAASRPAPARRRVAGSAARPVD